MVSSMVLRDHLDDDVSSNPLLHTLDAACRAALKERLSAVDAADLPALPEATQALPAAARAPTDGVTIGYLLMAHRRFAEATLSRF